MVTQFTQGNQARLDVTREELHSILEALIEERNAYADEKIKAKEALRFDESVRKQYETAYANMDKYERLIEKVREALDLYQ